MILVFHMAFPTDTRRSVWLIIIVFFAKYVSVLHSGMEKSYLRTRVSRCVVFLFIAGYVICCRLGESINRNTGLVAMGLSRSPNGLYTIASAAAEAIDNTLCVYACQYDLSHGVVWWLSESNTALMHCQLQDCI